MIQRSLGLTQILLIIRQYGSFRIIRESFSHETILFLEDDVLFSSKFSKIIGEVEKHRIAIVLSML